MLSVEIKIAIIIVNYNTSKLILDCLTSLKSEIKSLQSAKVFIVDNSSTDNSIEVIQKKVRSENWSDWVSIIKNSENRGFSSGNNVAIKRLLYLQLPPDYFMFLNPDTAIKKGAINTLCRFIDKRPKAAGIVGGQLEGMDGTIKCCSAHHFPTPIREISSFWRAPQLLSKILSKCVRSPAVIGGVQQADWVSGACCLMRREIFQSVGLFDESYFLYFEDVDLCRRAKNSGWEVWYAPNSRIRHLGGGSTKNNFERFDRPDEWYDSRKIYYCKHYGLLGLIVADIFRLVSFFTIFFASIINRKLRSSKLIDFSLLKFVVKDFRKSK